MKNQYNRDTGKVYEGRNQAILRDKKEENDFTSDAWLTFVQANKLGYKIKKGSKGTGIFNGYREVETVNTKTNKITTETRPMGISKVFNLDQVEKITS